MEVRTYNLNEVILDIILTIEKHRVPIMFLDQILSGVKTEVQLHQIIGRSEIGLTPEAYTEMLEGIRKDLENARKLQGIKEVETPKARPQ